MPITCSLLEESFALVTADRVRPSWNSPGDSDERLFPSRSRVPVSNELLTVACG